MNPAELADAAEATARGLLQMAEALRQGAAQTDVPEPHAGPEFVSLRGAAAMTDLSYHTLYEALSEGRLAGHKVGHVWRLKPADVRAWMDTHRVEARPYRRKTA